MAEHARASLAAQERVAALVDKLEKQSSDLITLVQRSPRGPEEDQPKYRLSLAIPGGQLSSLEGELGALLFQDNYSEAKDDQEEDEVEEEERDGAQTRVLSPSAAMAQMRYQTTSGQTAPFTQDLEKTRNIANRRCQRLLQGYERFKQQQETAYRKKLSKLRARSGIDKLLALTEGRNRTRDRLHFELNSKTDLLAAAPVEESADPQKSYAAREMERLAQSIAATKEGIAQCLAQQAVCNAKSACLQEQLGLLVYDASRTRYR